MCLTPSAGHETEGFTLIELMVVITIIGVMTALMIPEMKGSFQDALLRSSTRDLINVFDGACSRSVSLNQLRRVRFDEATGRYSVEKQVSAEGQENFVPADDAPGSPGCLDPRIKIQFQPSGNESSTPESSPVQAAIGAGSSEATIMFYPDGTADASQIILQDRDGFRLGLRINPVTARVQILELAREGTP